MVQVNVTLTETIKKLLEEKKYSTLKDILTTMMPFDIAAVFSELQSEKTPILFRILPKELAAETFVEMDEDTQEFLIHGFSDSELKEIVDGLFVDDAVDLIEEMPANVVKRILRQADKEKGLTIVAVRMFISENGYAKLVVALARGKKEYDKRQTIKERDIRREMERD